MWQQSAAVYEKGEKVGSGVYVGGISENVIFGL